MDTDPDTRLRATSLHRRLLFWRGGAVAFFVLACIVAFAHPSGGGWPGHPGPHLVHLKVQGIVASDEHENVEALRKAADDDAVRGLVLEVNSPGGAVTGGEELHDAVAAFARRKPVVVSMGSVAASAGYMISVPASRIFANRSTLTGSIGVILESPDVSTLLDRVGVHVDQLVSGPMKGQPSVVRPLSPEGRGMLQDVIADLYDFFVNVVAQDRHMPVGRVRELADGRPYTGQQALKLGLVDEIGSMEDARQWLARSTHLPGDARPVDIGPAATRGWWRHLVAGVLSGMPGAEFLLKEGSALDGAVAIWKL
ncbi:signal peptide peptidase SppA [Komagataeibacter sp. FNDCF1]|uniref:signal peptide peptidase SppA n=1 Tax=Komagataeibacter sp. FNDCF1 TaxID=2878681 RepID=UPI001E2BC22E|nr:signal peptide peptidase SppA [Komagataeibacter sp. FNDCF1]MCE2564087.1 signal peptide peptidase SppA [Komagataeibacter sp. FNDCF1]